MAQTGTRSVLAVIVSYNPELPVLQQSLEALAQTDCHTVVVDNASQQQAKLQQLVREMNAVIIVALDSNRGLGYAQNRGIKLAIEHGYDYVLILDQDSIISCETLQALLDAHRRKTEQGIKLSAVGSWYQHGSQTEPVFVRFAPLKFSRHSLESQDADGCIETDFLISSGCLLSTRTLQEVGLMDEGLFIDHVDTEWFLRARDLGLRAFGVVAAQMQHSLGESSHQLRLGQRQRNVPQHSAFRYYYIFRNSIVLYKRSYVSKLWIWNDLQRLLMMLIFFGLFKKPRLRNLKMMLKGVSHGLRGKQGPIKSEGDSA